MTGRKPRAGGAVAGWRSPQAADAHGVKPEPYRGGRSSASRSRPATLSGWLTPSEGDGSAGAEAPEAVLARRDNIGRLSVQAIFSGWRTPIWKDGEHRERGMDVRRPPWELPFDLRDYAMEAGWSMEMTEKLDPEGKVYAVYLPAGWNTPSATDAKGGYQGGRKRDGENWSAERLDQTAQLATTESIPETLGLTAVGSIAGTAKSARLNPSFSRWLMGFPKEWDCCGVTAMRSCRKSGRRSSKPSSTPKKRGSGCED